MRSLANSGDVTDDPKFCLQKIEWTKAYRTRCASLSVPPFETNMPTKRLKKQEYTPDSSALADDEGEYAKTTGPGEGTGALEKALDVLAAVGDSSEGLSQSDLATELQLPRTTVYRLLATLVARGLVRRDPLRKVYCLGFKCFEMARKAYAQPDLVSSAAMELRALRDITGETTYLAALDGREVISLERCDGAHSKRSAAVLGQRKPVYCTSQGKAILSAMPDMERDALIRDITLRELTPLTITDRRRLQAEIRITKARGYAIDDEEIVLGVRCVGAPIVDPAGQVRGAVSVAGPAWRLTRARLELLGHEVAEAARRIGAQLLPTHQTESHSAETEVQAVAGPWAFHGAHPLDVPAHGLLWADTLAPSVRLLQNGNDRAFLNSCAAPVAGLVTQSDGILVVTQAESAVWDGAGNKVRDFPWPSGKTLAVCSGGDGTIWAAMALEDAGAAIGEVQADGGLKVHWRLREPVAAIRYRDSDATLFATLPESGSILLLKPHQPAQRRLASIPRGSGRLGGIAFDDEDGLWAALYDGWSVVRITMDGHLERVVGLPVPCPTDVAFVHAEGRRQLVVTTSRHSMPLDTLAAAPLSGRILLVTL